MACETNWSRVYLIRDVLNVLIVANRRHTSSEVCHSSKGYKTKGPGDAGHGENSPSSSLVFEDLLNQLQVPIHKYRKHMDMMVVQYNK